jgi:hypothetical protein
MGFCRRRARDEVSDAGESTTAAPTWAEELCRFEPHLTDSQGVVWDRCLAHDRLAPRDAYACEGYVPRPNEA